jgi:hypothetical protein
LLSRKFVVFGVSLAVAIFGGIACRDSSSRLSQEASAPTVEKQPVAFASHEFDASAPPANMPPLSPRETAVCDSDFLSSAIVRGEPRQTDATHATLTITQVKVTLQLKINIWLPAGANQHLMEHEDGHRQISEYYYQTADKLAERIAAPYLGKQVEVTGTDLSAESSRMLQQMASEITKEYGQELNPNPTQLLYDSITDHSRNDVAAKDAVAHAIKNAAIEAVGAK